MSDHIVYEVLGHEVGPELPYEVARCCGDALAFCLATLREEGQLKDGSRVGVLYRPDPNDAGEWLVNPWAKGRKR